MSSVKKVIVLSILLVLLILLPVTTYGEDNQPKSSKLTLVEVINGNEINSELVSNTTNKKYEENYLLHTNVGAFDPKLEKEPNKSIPDSLKTKIIDDNAAQYIVQFYNNGAEMTKKTIETLNGRIYGFFDNNSYRVKMHPKEVEKLLESDVVRAVVPFHPAYKIDKALKNENGDLFKSLNNLSDIDIAILVWDNDSLKRIQKLIIDEGGELLNNTSGTETLIEARVNINFIPKIAGDPEVTYIQLAGKPMPSLNTARSITGVETVAWPNGWNGSGETISIVDTGININHQAISNRILATETYGNPSASTDTNGHGTHVAGIVASSGSGSDGFSKMGYTPVAQIFNQAYIGCQNSCPSLNRLHTDAWGRGVRVSNNSWTFGTGIPINQYDAYARELDNYIYNTTENGSNGVPKRTYVIVQAAGNSGSLESPGSAKNIITVGGSFNNATTSSNIPNGSGSGPTVDGRTKPDIVAPGYDVVSLRSQNSSLPAYNGNTLYTQLGGTSMAAPQVSSAAAILRQYYKTNNYTTPSSALIKAQLINGAKKIDSIRQGWGLLNFDGSFRWWDYADQYSIANDVWSRFQIDIGSNVTPFKATITWTDPPGDPSNANTDVTINDLDLFLVSPSGISYSSTSGNETVEKVIVDNPEVGTWDIYIHGFQVNTASQDYALVATHF